MPTPDKPSSNEALAALRELDAAMTKLWPGGVSQVPPLAAAWDHARMVLAKGDAS